MTERPEPPVWDPWGQSTPNEPEPVPGGGDHPAPAQHTSSAPTEWETAPPAYTQPLTHTQPQPQLGQPAWGTPEPAPRRAARGPGWGVFIGTAGIVALVAGVGGGLVGGYLGASGRPASPAAGQVVGAVPTPGPGATLRPDGSIANVAAKAMPSVVTIRVQAARGSGSGSGWVLDEQGHIVTNNHVISAAAEGSGGTVTVVLTTGKHLEASIIGRDASYDLAVLKVDRADLTPLGVGDSESVVVGDPVIAVGAPLGLDSSVTSGIVSALNRPVSAGDSGDRSFINAIQTDAAINPGNSGGPLLNMAGQVIGVNSAIASIPGLGGQAGNIGVGFAIPSNQVVKTADQLIRTGRAQHPIIGVYLDESYDGEGVRIGSDAGGRPAVTPGGPADVAGLKAGDVIVAFNGRPVTTPDELIVAIRAQDVGDTVTLTLRRDGVDKDVTMVLGKAGD